MSKPTGTATTAKTFILAGKTEDGIWHKIETATTDEGESVEDVKTFLHTMAHAHSRHFVETDILTEAEFIERIAAQKIAA